MATNRSATSARDDWRRETFDYLGATRSQVSGDGATVIVALTARQIDRLLDLIAEEED